MKISEYVSIGHPDKIADYISEYILDKYIEKDPTTKYALEVQIKDNFVTLGGEIKSECTFTKDEIDTFVKEAVDDIGYTKDYQDKWGKENTICSNDLIITQHIGIQSPEINQGLSGWGDQGIMFGMATNDRTTNYMPKDYHIAKELNNILFKSGLGGLDIKTQVVMEDDGTISKIIVAIPLLVNNTKIVEDFIRNKFRNNYKLIVNGTGCYKAHSSIADCGTTGRKLAVDFYGGNCVIGGGSPWTKDGSKADLTLNLFARDMALKYIKMFPEYNYVKSSVACCIGKKEIDLEVLTDTGDILVKGVQAICPNDLIEKYKLNTPIYRHLYKNGLFSII